MHPCRQGFNVWDQINLFDWCGDHCWRSCGICRQETEGFHLELRKLMKATVPQNGLSAIMLGTELEYLVVKSMHSKVEDVIFATDSTIALSWCCNTTKKLRLFVFSRVETIRRMIEWTTGWDYLPIYHVDEALNLSDLLTKKHDLTVDCLLALSGEQDSLGWNWELRTCH